MVMQIKLVVVVVVVVVVSQNGGHCARRSLRTPWKLGLRIVA